jgi:hypothetical protein
MKSALPILGAVLLVLGLVASFALDYSQTTKDGAVDFRNRITGVRLLERGLDPYHHLWHAGDPEEFCDTRNNPRMTVTKTTVSPPMLVLYAPLAALPYRAAEFVWLFTQWLLLLMTLGMWLRTGTPPLKLWLAAIFVVSFTFTPGWRWEAERGQCYTLLAFLLAYVLAPGRVGGRADDFLVGAVAGVLVALRPSNVVLLPFLTMHRPRQFIGVLAGLSVALAVPVLLHPQVWIEYLTAMQANSVYYRDGALPQRPSESFPATIEGTPLATMSAMTSYPFVDLSVYAVARRFGFDALPDVPFVLLFGSLFLAWLFVTRKRPAELLLPGMAAWIFLSDFILPTTRWGYYDVMILNVILALIAVNRRIPCAAWTALLAVPVMWTFSLFEKTPTALVYVPQILFLVSAVLALFPSDERAAD